LLYNRSHKCANTVSWTLVLSSNPPPHLQRQTNSKTSWASWQPASHGFPAWPEDASEDVSSICGDGAIGYSFRTEVNTGPPHYELRKCNVTLLCWIDFIWFQLAAVTSEQTACWWTEGAVEYCMGVWVHGWQDRNLRGEDIVLLANLIYVITFCDNFLLKHNRHIHRGIPVFPDCYWTRNIYMYIFSLLMNVLILIIMTKHDESGSKYYDPPLWGTETMPR
jgi:hypothetical protein